MAMRKPDRFKMSEHPTIPMTKEMLDRVRARAETENRTCAELMRQYIDSGMKLAEKMAGAHGEPSRSENPL